MSEAIEKLGNLTPAQAEIFKIILMRSPASLAIIGAYTKKKSDQIQKTIKELEGLKFVKSVPGVVPRYVGLPPYAGYLKFLDKFTADLATAKTQATDSINQVPTLATALAQANTQKLAEVVQAAETKATEAVKAAKADLAAKVTAEKDKFAADLTKLTDDLALVTKDAPDKYKKATVVTVDKHKVTFEKLKTDLAAELDKISSKLDQSLQATEGTQQKALDTQKATVSAKIEEGSTAIIEASGKVGGDWTENTTQMGSSLDEKVETLKTKVEELGKNSVTSMQASVDAAVAAFSKFLQTFNKTHQTNLKALDKGVQGDLTTFQNTQVSAWDGTIASLGDQFGKTTLALQSLTEKLKANFEGQVNTLVDKETKGISSKLDQIKAQLADLMAKYVEEFIGGADKIKTTIDQTVEAQVAKTQGEIKQTLDGILEKYTDEIRSQASTYATDLKNQINDKVVDLRASIKQMREQFEADLASSAETLSENLTKLKTEMTNQIGTLEQDLSAKLGEGITKGKEDAASVIDTGKTSLQETITKHKESLGGVITKNQETLSNSISETESKLQETASSGKDTMATQVQAESTSFASQITEIINSTKKAITDQANAAVATATTNKDTLIKATASFNEQVAAILTEAQEGIKAIYGQLDMDLKKPVEDFKASSVTKLDGALADVTAMATETGNAYTKSGEDLALKAKKSTDALKVGVDKHMAAADQQLVGTAGAGVTAVSSAAGSVKSNVELALKDWAAKVQGMATTAVQGVDKAITTGIAAADSPKKVLAETWTAITETSLIDAEKTWAIVGEQAIYPQIDDMIRAAKSAMILVAPKFDDLNWDLIKAARAKGVKFTVACVYETAKSAKAPKAMVENGVDLWGYAEKDMIAAVRDQEEILVAPVSPKEDETVAIVSSATPLVKNLGSMLLDFYRRTAKKYVNV